MVSNSPTSSVPLIYPLPIADSILNSTLNIPLHGIAIGNGWIDSNSQYLSYLDYAVKVGLIEENTDVRSFSRSHITSYRSHEPYSPGKM